MKQKLCNIDAIYCLYVAYVEIVNRVCFELNCIKLSPFTNIFYINILKQNKLCICTIKILKNLFEVFKNFLNVAIICI